MGCRVRAALNGPQTPQVLSSAVGLLWVLLRFGASHLVLAAAGQWMVSLAMQVPWFSLLPNSGEVQPQGSQSQRGGQAGEKPADVALLLPDSPRSKTGKPSSEMAGF